MSAVVALNWVEVDGVVHGYLSKFPSRVYGPDADRRFKNATGAYSAENFEAALPPERLPAILADVRKRAGAISGAVLRLAGEGVARAYDEGLEARLFEIALTVEALDAIHATHGIDVILVSEDIMHTAKAAVLWARANQVPSLCISHSCILGRTYTVHEGLRADVLSVFGVRGAERYLEDGVPSRRIVASGNPAWDHYAALVPKRAEVRASVRAQCGIADAAPVALFATTWSAYLTTLEEPDAYDRSLRAFFKACKQVRDAGLAVVPIVKDRRHDRLKPGYVEALAAEAGISDARIFREHLPELIAAADVVVSVNSNISIEAAIVGVPAINLWSPFTFFNGGMATATDGVFEADPDQLANALAIVLTDKKAAAVFCAQAAQWRERAAANVGTATAQTVDLLAALRKPTRVKRNQYVWQEIAAPTSVFDKGSTAEYYNHPRVELIALLRHEPRNVLDIGCAGGATGAALKLQYPKAYVAGIEMSLEATQFASGRIDRVLLENAETLDFSTVGYTPGSVDVVFLPDVLEHLYDPWRLLDRLKPYLSRDAQILASIPNVRNMWLINELLRGRWDYVEEGLLDVTHIRFFTRKGVAELFEQTGYRIERWGTNYDPRVPVMNAPDGQTVNVETELLRVNQLAQIDLEELRTLQFLVDAVPAAPAPELDGA